MSSTSALNCIDSPSEMVLRIERILSPMRRSSYIQFSAFQIGMAACVDGSGLGFMAFIGRIAFYNTAMSDRYFEDYVLNEQRETSGRTITEADIVFHAGHTGDFFPHHLDAEFAKTTSFGQRIA